MTVSISERRDKCGGVCEIRSEEEEQEQFEQLCRAGQATGVVEGGTEEEETERERVRVE
jgi:hypothetical protein